VELELYSGAAMFGTLVYPRIGFVSLRKFVAAGLSEFDLVLFTYRFSATGGV